VDDFESLVDIGNLGCLVAVSIGHQILAIVFPTSATKLPITVWKLFSHRPDILREEVRPGSGKSARFRCCVRPEPPPARSKLLRTKLWWHGLRVDNPDSPGMHSIEVVRFCSACVYCSLKLFDDQLSAIEGRSAASSVATNTASVARCCSNEKGQYYQRNHQFSDQSLWHLLTPIFQIRCQTVRQHLLICLSGHHVVLVVAVPNQDRAVTLG